MKQIIFTTILVLVFSTSVFAQNDKLGCATIEVTHGGVVRTGEPMNFTANVTGITKDLTLEYEWKVSSGTISSGQGTPSITVDTTDLEDTNITAEIKIKGLYDNCAASASETGSVMRKTPVCGMSLDQYGKLSNNEVKARMDALFLELDNEPNGQGYIINYGTDEEIAVREKQIQKAITFRKYDANRITIVRSGTNPNGAGVWMKVWIVPPGADNPQL
ncbi:MAG: hypothetical protein ABJA66_03450 [Actinomycetota bacterium]